MCRTPPLNKNVINDFITSGMWADNEKIIFAKHMIISSDYDEEYHKVMTIDENGTIRTYTKDTLPNEGEWFSYLY